MILDSTRLELRLVTPIDFEVDGPSMTVFVVLEKFGLQSVVYPYEISILNVNEPPSLKMLARPASYRKTLLKDACNISQRFRLARFAVYDPDDGDVPNVLQTNTSASAFIYDTAMHSQVYWHPGTGLRESS